VKNTKHQSPNTNPIPMGRVLDAIRRCVRDSHQDLAERIARRVALIELPTPKPEAWREN
jgi:hypothetical protein